jgi:hypothetical protein
MSAETVITVDLRKNARIPGARIETPAEIMTIASGAPMERAAAQAFAQLILWMEADYGWNRWRRTTPDASPNSIGYYATYRRGQGRQRYLEPAGSPPAFDCGGRTALKFRPLRARIQRGGIRCVALLSCWYSSVDAAATPKEAPDRALPPDAVFREAGPNVKGEGYNLCARSDVADLAERRRRSPGVEALALDRQARPGKTQDGLFVYRRRQQSQKPEQAPARGELATYTGRWWPSCTAPNQPLFFRFEGRGRSEDNLMPHASHGNA